MTEVTEFDFSRKVETKISLDNINTDRSENRYIWINTDSEQLEDVVPALQKLCPNQQIGSEFFQNGMQDLIDFRSSLLQFTLSESFFSNGNFITKPIRIILGKGFMATIRQGHSEVIERMEETYLDDFINFSKSPGFLLFEIIDHLSTLYQDTFRTFEQEISDLQLKLFEETDDDIFLRVAQLTGQLISFRSALVSAREVTNVLASRKSPFIAETTQPFLERKESLFDSLSTDLSDQRAVLSDTLNLYMGFVSHRTNRVLKKLTVISVIFLPLTFLVGIYGMNFEYMPELGWKYGYPFFWLIVLFIVGASLYYISRMKWF